MTEPELAKILYALESVFKKEGEQIFRKLIKHLK